MLALDVINAMKTRQLWLKLVRAHDVTNIASTRQPGLEQVLEGLETNVTMDSQRHQHRGQFSDDKSASSSVRTPHRKPRTRV